MKKYSTSFSFLLSIFYLIIILFFSYSLAIADELVLKNGSIIECKILKVTPNKIIYNQINSEVVETIQRTQVTKIKYPDGDEIQLEDTANDLIINKEQEIKSPNFMIKNYYEIRALFLTIDQDKHSENSDSISYHPNSGNNLGATIEYMGFGLSYSISGFNKQDESKYGKTKANDIQIFYYADKLGIDVYYQRYQGFYLYEPEEFNYNIGDPETKRSDLKINTYGFNFFYNIFDLYSFLKKNGKTNLDYATSFSFLNTFEQIKRHENGLSIALLAMFSALHYDIDSNRSLIPASHQIYYGDFSTFKGGEFNSIGISFGAGFSLAYHDLFISIIGFFGSGYMHKKYEMEEESINQNGSFNKINAKIVLGYNGNMFAGGLRFQMDEVTAEESNDSINIQTEIMNVQFFFAYKI